MTLNNLRHMFAQADETDFAEGCLAYPRYGQVLQAFAQAYSIPFDRTVAAFCDLSPNNDYYGNLRSLASVLQAVRDGVPCCRVTVSTYNHCRDRAYACATGGVPFLARAKGLKIRSFYQNILNPKDPAPVTIDGHMKAAYLAQPLTMREALVRTQGEYKEIVAATRTLAKEQGLVGNQVQAIIWFARKRTLRIKYMAQLDLFRAADDQWGTLVAVEDALPYPYTKGI